MRARFFQRPCALASLRSAQHHPRRDAGSLAGDLRTGGNCPMPTERLRVLLADDNLIVRAGIRSLLNLAPDIEVVGDAADCAELLRRVEELEPHVVVTDIRMPPDFRLEGIEAAREIRRRHPGTGVVVLSQYDAPEYAIELLAQGATGCAFLLKDRVAAGDELVKAVRAVASGQSVLDPIVVESLTRPMTVEGNLSVDEERLLRLVAEGRSVKGIAAALRLPPALAATRLD